MRWTLPWVVLLYVLFGTAILLLVLYLTQVGELLHQRIPDRPRRRLFIAWVSFFITFLVVRLLVMAITHHVGPFHWIIMKGTHIHHLVWGILLLLLVGFGDMAEVGNRNTRGSIFLSRLFAILYGVGAALTLDEFALWLNLKDVYWTSQGRESLDAVVLFGSLLAIATWGAPLWHGVRRQKHRLTRVAKPGARSRKKTHAQKSSKHASR